jgi:hypothetical protein
METILIVLGLSRSNLNQINANAVVTLHQRRQRQQKQQPNMTTNIPLPMPDPDASDEEWNEYLNDLTLDELNELLDYFERLVKASRKRKRELQSLGAA